MKDTTGFVLTVMGAKLSAQRIKKCRAGFLMLEVLLCVVVIGGAFLYTARFQHSAQLTIERSGWALRAAALANEKMFEYCLQSPALGVSSGRFSGTDVRWKTEVSAVEESDLKNLSLRIIPKDNRMPDFMMESYLENKERERDDSS